MLMEARTVGVGLLAGLAGTAAMNLVSVVWSAAAGRDGQPEDSHHQQGSRPDVEHAKEELWPAEAPGSIATTRTAEAIAAPVLQRPLSGEERRRGGTLVHYSFGASAGVVYCLTATGWPAITAGRGAIFGMLVWAGAVASVLPALGLAAPVTRYSMKENAYGVAGHLAYGVALEAVRRALAKRTD